MIHNTRIDLSPTSTARSDAIGSIKYTLFLNNQLPDISNPNNAISEIINTCKKCCSELLGEKSTIINSKEIKFLTFNFFGTATRPFRSKLSSLNTEYENSETLSFSDMILHHCVMSSYHTILTDLLNEYTITGYDVCHNVKNLGIDALRSNAMLSFKNGKITMNKMKTPNNSGKSGQASDLWRAANSHLSNINNVRDVFKVPINNETNKDTTSKYYLQFAGLFKNICEINAAQWRFSLDNNSNSPKDKRTKDSILNHLDTLPSTLIKKCDGNSIDQYYHKYIIERLFGFDLINCIMQNIQRIEKTGILLGSTELLHILCKSKQLQNVFSRTVFIQYAFDHYLTAPNSYDDYWNEQSKVPQRTNMKDVLESTNGTPSGFFQSRWITQFSYFCDYMSNFIIPVYEWCFIDMLLRYEEQRNPRCSHQQHLLNIIDLLKTYMLQHEQDLTKTLTEEFPDLIFPGASYISIDIPESYKKQILADFLVKDYDMDLNIKLINPQFFLNEKKFDRFFPYKELYRKFNIRVVKELYLDETLNQ